MSPAGRSVADLFWLAFCSILHSCGDREYNEYKSYADDIFFASFMHILNDRAIEKKRREIQISLPPRLKCLMDDYVIYESGLILNLFDEFTNAAIIKCDCKTILIFDEVEDKVMSLINLYINDVVISRVFYVKKPKIFHEHFKNNICFREENKYRFLIFRAYSFNAPKKNKTRYFIKNCKGKLKKPCLFCKREKRLHLRWSKNQGIMICQQ